MAFDSFSDFIAMGGYGFYVWASMASFVILVGGFWLLSRWQEKRLMGQIRRFHQRRQRFQQHHQGGE